MKLRKLCLIVAAALIISVLFCSCSTKSGSESPADREPEFSTFEELSGKNISMTTGAPFEELIKSKVPDVGSFSYYASPPELLMALKTKKTDAVLFNTALQELFVNQESAVAAFPIPLKETDFGIGFSKDYKEYDKWQKAFDSLDPDDVEAIWQKWVGSDESKKVMPEVDWDGSAGKVTVAVGDSMKPSSYVGSDGEVLGLEPEIILLIAKQLNYSVEFVPMEFSALIASVEAGKADMCAGSIVITPEREKALSFIAYHDTAFVFLVRAKDSGTYNIFGQLGEKFKSTLITEGRYKLILSGLKTTIIISLCSGIIGLILAYIMVSLHQKKWKLIDGVIKVYCRLVAGLPVVVILMLLYYVVFASAKISAVFIATVGFSIIFAPKAYSIITSGIDAIDKGQREAALALGYTQKKAFRRVILPQAARIYFPLLSNQFSLLVKETSVAGFIAVVDLTRAGDIIRGHTLEAFYPLITIAVIYFILTWLISTLINLVKRLYDNMKRRADE